MVSSSKKKRGQQRKKDRIPDVSFTSKDDGSSAEVQPDHKKYIIQHIEGGSHYVTNVLASYEVADFSLEDSGVLTVVLDLLLKRCEDESFSTLVLRANTNEKLKAPSLWIDILDQAVANEPRCMLQIAENIGPLVRCMCADTTRLFFKSNKHWRKGIMSFVRLIYNMIYTCCVKLKTKRLYKLLSRRMRDYLHLLFNGGIGEKRIDLILQEN